MNETAHHIDWFYQLENLKVNCSDVLWNIIELIEEVEDEGRYNIFIHSTDAGIDWHVCNGFLSVELSWEDGSGWDEYVTLPIPFEWLDMGEDELREAINADKEERDNSELQSKLENLICDANRLGYKLIKGE